MPAIVCRTKLKFRLKSDSVRLFQLILIIQLKTEISQNNAAVARTKWYS